MDTIGIGIGHFTYLNIDSFIQGIEWIYALLITVSGYISNLIPGIKKINKNVYRVLALAIIIGLGFYFGANTSLLRLVLTYTFTTSFYEIILKLLFKKQNTSEEQ